MTARRAALALGLAGAGALASAPAAATQASTLGVGPKGRALSGAGATQELGHEASFVNPATLALTTRPTLAAGFGFRRASLFWQKAGGEEHASDGGAASLSELGFTLPLPLVPLPLVLGFAGSSMSGTVAHADLPLAEQPQFPLLSGGSRAVDFDLALGLRVARWLSVGVGLRALSSLSGTSQVVRGKKATTTQVSDTLEPVLAPLGGVLLAFGESTRLAVVARAPLRADFDMQLSAVDLGATQLPPLELAGVAAYDPWSVTLEAARSQGPVTALVAADYRRYRDTPPLLPATVRCPPERPDCSALTTLPGNFHDTVDLHAAGIWRLALRRSAQAMLRAGYAYIPSPIPEQTGSANLLDSARHRLALGYGLELSAPLPPLALDAALTFDQLRSRTSRKSPEVAADNPGAPSLRSGGHVLSLSLGVTVKL